MLSTGLETGLANLLSKLEACQGIGDTLHSDALSAYLAARSFSLQHRSELSKDNQSTVDHVIKAISAAKSALAAGHIEKGLALLRSAYESTLALYGALTGTDQSDAMALNYVDISSLLTRHFAVPYGLQERKRPQKEQ